MRIFGLHNFKTHGPIESRVYHYGEGNKGRRFSEEIRQKMSERMRSTPLSEAWMENMRQGRIRYWEERRKKAVA